MGHSKLPWRVCDKHSQTGKNMIGYEICVVDGHVSIASVLFLRHGAKRGESPKYIEDPSDKANANLIVTAVNVMPEVKRIVKGLLQLNESFPTGVDSVDAELSGYIGKGHDLLEKLEGVS